MERFFLTRKLKKTSLHKRFINSCSGANICQKLMNLQFTWSTEACKNKWTMRIIELMIAVKCITVPRKYVKYAILKKIHLKDSGSIVTEKESQIPQSAFFSLTITAWFRANLDVRFGQNVQLNNQDLTSFAKEKKEWKSLYWERCLQ